MHPLLQCTLLPLAVSPKKAVRREETPHTFHMTSFSGTQVGWKRIVLKLFNPLTHPTVLAAMAWAIDMETLELPIYQCPSLRLDG